MRRLRAALLPALLALLACSGLGEPPIEPDAIDRAEQPPGEAFRQQPHSALTLPEGATAETPLTTPIWLHGHGGDPWLADAAVVRRLSESRGVAVLGVSGTLPMDGGGYTWTEDAARDLARIDAALAERAEAACRSPPSRPRWPSGWRPRPPRSWPWWPRS